MIHKIKIILTCETEVNTSDWDDFQEELAKHGSLEAIVKNDIEEGTWDLAELVCYNDNLTIKVEKV